MGRTSVRDFTVDPWLDAAIEAFDSQALLGVPYLALSRTIIDRPENHKKLEDSYSGFAVHIQNIAVLAQLQMWCVRLWDRNGISLPMLGERLSSKAMDIAHVRALAHPDWPASQLGILQLPTVVFEFCLEIEKMAKTDLIARMKVRRDENFAHILPIGRAPSRKRLVELGVDEGYSLNEVVQLTEFTLGLISRARLLIWFETVDYLKSAESWQRHCERFWRLLPNLSELEEQERNERIRTRRLP